MQLTQKKGLHENENICKLCKFEILKIIVENSCQKMQQNKLLTLRTVSFKGKLEMWRTENAVLPVFGSNYECGRIIVKMANERTKTRGIL